MSDKPIPQEDIDAVIANIRKWAVPSYKDGWLIPMHPKIWEAMQTVTIQPLVLDIGRHTFGITLFTITFGAGHYGSLLEILFSPIGNDFDFLWIRLFKSLIKTWRNSRRNEKERNLLSLGATLFICPCGWEGSAYQAEPDVDGEGNLGCPLCGAIVHLDNREEE